MKIIGLITLVVLSPIIFPLAVIGMYVDEYRWAKEDEAEYRYNEAQKSKTLEAQKQAK